MTSAHGRNRSARLGALATLAVFGTLAGLVWQVQRVAGLPPDPLERKLVQAARLRYYTVTATSGPRFALARGARTVRLLSHAVMPAGTGEYDPARELTYGLRVELRAGDRVLWQRDLFARSRQSKARLERGVWLEENAFSPEAGVQVTDARHTLLELPVQRPEDAELHVLLAAGEASTALVRLYQRDERDAGARQLRLFKLSSGERETLVDDVTYLPWDRLAPGDLLARLRTVEKRVPAVGREGADYTSHILYVSDFHLARPSSVGDGDVLVAADHPAVVNVKGPAKLALTAAHAPGPPGVAPPPAHPPARLVMQPVSLAPEPGPVHVATALKPQLVPVAETAPTTRVFEVPAGLHSLELRTDASAGLRVVIQPDRAGAKVAPGGGKDPGVATPLLPETTVARAALAGDVGPPLIIALDGPPDLLGRAVRLDVRIPGAAGAPLPAHPAHGELRVDVVDGAGGEVAHARVPIEAGPSSFDSVAFLDGRVSRVSEAVSVKMIAPAAGRKLLVRSSIPMLVSTTIPATSDPSAGTPMAPFDAPSKTTAWRHAPRTGNQWHFTRPENLDALPPARLARVLMPLHLEEVPVVHDGPPGQALVPNGRLERRVAIEPLGPEESRRALVQWPPGTWFKLHPGEPANINFARAGTPASVQFWLPTPRLALGQPIEIRVDGEPVLIRRITSARGSFTLPPVVSVVHKVEVRTPVEDIHLLIDRPPAVRAQAGDLFAMRSLYAIPRAGVDLPIVRRGAEPLTLNIVIYGPRPEADPAAQLDIRVDGGRVRHALGKLFRIWTLANRTLAIPASDRPPITGFANQAETLALWPRRLAIGLGDDLSRGVHHVHMKTRGSDRALAHAWVRFFVAGPGVGEERALQWQASFDEPVAQVQPARIPRRRAGRAKAR
jgi:hypothetical protein